MGGKRRARERERERERKLAPTGAWMSEIGGAAALWPGGSSGLNQESKQGTILKLEF